MYIFIFILTCTLAWYSICFCILSVYMYSPLNLFGYWTLNKHYYYYIIIIIIVKHTKCHSSVQHVSLEVRVS